MLTNNVGSLPRRRRFRLRVNGVVQGVGFRPFVYNSAQRFGLSGFVGNNGSGVFIEVEGAEADLREFQRLLEHDPPALAYITSVEIEEIPVEHTIDFYITDSDAREGQNTLVSPDVSVCNDCLTELFAHGDRRFRYPFINCTNCGPRFTIIKRLPYDRPQTTMSVFSMCEPCRSEYNDPLDRRFHAQPNACPTCGPRIWFRPASGGGGEGADEIFGQEAMLAAQRLMEDGGIVAVKGIGGFHLACDARNDAALQRLRERKGRIDKPFAVMARSLAAIEELVELNDAERQLVTGKQRPIVLLRKKRGAKISAAVAPGNEYLGVMLPYSPLHYLLFDPVDERVAAPNVLVMTSGNLSDEPIVKDNHEALEKLSRLADGFLLHDRQIHVQCDDSVVRLVGESQIVRGSEFANRSFHELPVRRSRGYAPFPVELPVKLPPVLAVGGELKATFCLAQNEFAFMSQHIGDMENIETMRAFESAVEHMRNLFHIEPAVVACDRHPGYLSARWAKENMLRISTPGTALIEVQHHHAHIASVMAENAVTNKVIGFAFDGTGYGNDGTIWGGEVLLADYRSFERAAHLRYVPLAGGDASIKKPYRAALAHLWQAGVEWDERLPCVAACSRAERRILLKQLESGFNTVPASSFGRLFDAVASLAGVRHTVTYEAQAAIEFEAMLDESISSAYAFDLIDGEMTRIDPTGLVSEVAGDVLAHVPVSEISAKFNNAVSDLIVRLAINFRARENLNLVALSGGCFQNIALLKSSINKLREKDFEVFTHRKVPANDGGLALGQAMIAGCLSGSKRQAEQLR